MKADSQHSKTCPPAENLSAWHDGEVKDPTIQSHLDACSPCRNTVNDYQTIDQALTNILQVDDSLAGRIINHCREQNRTTAPYATLWFHYLPVLRYAAAAAILVAIGTAFFWTDTPDNRPKVAQIKQIEPTAHFTPTEPPVQPVLMAESPINSSDLISVSATGQSGITANEAGLWRAGANAIGSHVSHVWVINEQTITPVKNLLHQQFPHVTWEKSPQSNTLQLSASDQRIQEIVDFMQSQGCSLISPSLPQPGLQSRTYFSGNPVSYHMTIVPQSQKD